MTSSMNGPTPKSSQNPENVIYERTSFMNGPWCKLGGFAFVTDQTVNVLLPDVCRNAPQARKQCIATIKHNILYEKAS